MSPTPSSQWTILGPGAIGSLWASYWQVSGQTVTLLGRQPRQGNLKLQSPNQTLTIKQPVINSATFNKPICKLLVTTKASQTLAALESLRPLLQDGAKLLILQNGMAALDVQQHFPQQQVYAAVTTDGAYWHSPGHLIHAGQGLTTIGALSQCAARSLETLYQELPHRYLSIEAVADIQPRLWQKLAVNCAINALTVKYHCRNGELLNNPAAMNEIDDVCREIILLVKNLPLALDFSALEQQVRQVLRQTAANYSSMYQDITQGRDNEIDYINGYICRLAAKYQIDCPTNQALVTLIKNKQGGI